MRRQLLHSDSALFFYNQLLTMPCLQSSRLLSFLVSTECFLWWQCRPWTVKHWGSACQAQEHIRPYNYSKNPIACWTFCLNAVDKVLNACWSKCWRHLNEHFCSESLFGYKCLVKNQSWKQLMGVSREVRGIPVVQYNEQNRIILNNPKTDFIAVTTNFTKQDHLQLIKVLNSCKLTD